MADQNKTTVVETMFKAVGLDKLKGQWLDFAGELLEPMAILAAGGSKASAAWAGMRGIFLTKVLGPLGMLVGAATGFLLITRNIVKEWRAVGLQSAKAIETLTLQFKPLLGSLDLAKQRAREVFDFGVKSPFEFAELAEGNKILQGLTQGALATKEGMELVGDAAAVAGNGFAETARSVGRLYDGLMSGRPVGEAAMRLQELGLITGQTRNQIDAMQASNAAGSAIWAVVQADIARTKGAMKDLEESLEGLESAHADTKQALEAGFGAGFMEGEKAAVASATLVMERMVPVATTLGEMIGTVSNQFAKLRARTVEVVTGFPGFEKVVTTAALAVGGLAASILLATGLLLGRFLLGVVSAAVGNGHLAKSAAKSAGALAAQQVATTSLAGAQVRLAAATSAAAAKQYVAAAAHMKAAAAMTVAGVRSNFLAASQVILRGALGLTGKAIGFVLKQVVMLGVALLASPAFWFAAVLVGVGTALLYFSNQAKKAREEMAALAKAAQATVANLREQAAAIRSVADLRRAEADAVSKLAEAHKRLALAQGSGDRQAAKIAAGEVAGVRAALEAIRAKSGKTELGEVDVAAEDQAKARNKEARQARDSDEAGSGESAALAVARRRQAEGEALRAAEEEMVAAEKRIAAAQEESRRAVEDRAVEEGALLALREKAMQKKEQVNEAGGSGVPMEIIRAEVAAQDAIIAGLDEELEAIAALKAAEAARISALALADRSELAALNEKLGIYEALEAAGAAHRAALKAVAEAKPEDGAAAAAGEGEAARTLDLAQRAASGAGVDGWEARQAQQARRRVEEIKAERQQNLDPVANEERARAVRDAELALANARIEGESQIAGLRLKGYEREKAMLDFERQKLAVALAKGRVDADGHARQKAILDAEEAAMNRSAGERREELASVLQVGTLERRAEAARRAGDTGAEAALRAEAAALVERQALVDATRDAEGMGGDASVRSAYVARRTQEERAARESARALEEEERAAARDGSSADQGSAAATINARAEALRGRGKEARRTLEDAARVQDELDRKEKRKRYRAEGFTGERADAMADRDVKTAQAERLLREMGDNKGNVIASSLAVVGGGGNVSGSDPERKLQERMVTLLEELNDTTKASLGIQ